MPVIVAITTVGKDVSVHEYWQLRGQNHSFFKDGEKQGTKTNDEKNELK